jgi:glutamine amidotransferase
MSSKIIIVDYGMGNLHSVRKMMNALSADSKISSDPQEITGGDKIILPGVGHFGKAMANLKQLNLIDALNEAVLVKQKPVLGICLGMHLMAESSEEGDSAGLGWIEGEVFKFKVSDSIKYKIPHMGWNQITVKKHSPLTNNLFPSSEFYFAHSYYLKTRQKNHILTETEYDFNFPAAIEKDNIFGVQFHPEKSYDAGALLLKNFLKL